MPAPDFMTETNLRLGAQSLYFAGIPLLAFVVSLFYFFAALRAQGYRAGIGVRISILIWHIVAGIAGFVAGFMVTADIGGSLTPPFFEIFFFDVGLLIVFFIRAIISIVIPCFFGFVALTTIKNLTWSQRKNILSTYCLAFSPFFFPIGFVIGFMRIRFAQRTRR